MVLRVVGMPSGATSTLTTAWTAVVEKASAVKRDIKDKAYHEVAVELLKWVLAMFSDFVHQPVATTAWCLIGSLRELYRWFWSASVPHSFFGADALGYMTSLMPGSTSSDVVTVIKSVTSSVTMFAVGQWLIKAGDEWWGHTGPGGPKPGTEWLAAGGHFDGSFAMMLASTAVRCVTLYSMWKSVSTMAAPGVKIILRTLGGFLASAKSYPHSYVPAEGVVMAPQSIFDNVVVLFEGTHPVGVGCLLAACDSVLLVTAAHVVHNKDIRVPKSVGAGPFICDELHDYAVAETSLDVGLFAAVPEDLTSGSMVVGFNGRGLCVATSPNGVALAPTVFSTQGLTCPGCSGGPVFDGAGHFVGIDVAGEGNVGYGVPAALIEQRWASSHGSVVRHTADGDAVTRRRRKGDPTVMPEEADDWWADFGAARHALRSNRVASAAEVERTATIVARAVVAATQALDPKGRSAPVGQVEAHAQALPGSGLTRNSRRFLKWQAKQAHSAASDAPTSPVGAHAAAAAASSSTSGSLPGPTLLVSTLSPPPHSTQLTSGSSSTTASMRPPVLGGHTAL
jgi:hypothetical protein